MYEFHQRSSIDSLMIPPSFSELDSMNLQRFIRNFAVSILHWPSCHPDEVHLIKCTQMYMCTHKCIQPTDKHYARTLRFNRTDLYPIKSVAEINSNSNRNSEFSQGSWVPTVHNESDVGIYESRWMSSTGWITEKSRETNRRRKITSKSRCINLGT